MPSLDSISRREVLRIGALGILGSSLPTEFAAAKAHSTGTDERSCIFMLLQGGPSHHDLWDPKPQAPVEVRGEFDTIATTLPGVRFGELLKQTAKITDHLAIVRSVTHKFNNHIAGTYIALTGSEDQVNRDREADANDFPGPGAIVNYLQNAHAKVPGSISLPTWLSIPGPSNRMPGQYGGFLGSLFDPLLISGQPHKPEFKPRSMTLPDSVSPERIQNRSDLLNTLNSSVQTLETEGTKNHKRFRETAYELLTDPKVRRAMDLTSESDKVRREYGMTKIGQSLLLARRLVEAGVRFVGYNEFNQDWDHHSNIVKALSSRVPAMEQGFAALVGDLHRRGMLEKTLVINTGEFGRTPKINNQKGRDHWPNVYSSIMAGGGLPGGQVYGSSDGKGAEVKEDPVAPADILATMWHCLGIDPHRIVHDRFNRPVPLTRGNVLSKLI